MINNRVVRAERRTKGGTVAGPRGLLVPLRLSAKHCSVTGPLSNDFHSGRDSCVHIGFIWYRYFNPSLLRDPLKYPANRVDLQPLAEKYIESRDLRVKASPGF